MKSALAGTLERARSTFSTISLGQKVVIGLLAVVERATNMYQAALQLGKG